MAALYANEGRSFVAAEVKAFVDMKDPDGPGEFEAVLSAPTLDRDSEIIDAGAFEPLPEHITIDTDHAFEVSKVVGSGRPFYDGDMLKIRGTFSAKPEAQALRRDIIDGHIRTMSVAFMAADRKDVEGVRHVVKGELLNASFVPIPANREALVTAAKAAKAGARNSSTDMERLQQIHDLTVENGAACDGKAVRLAAYQKAIDAMVEDQTLVAELRTELGVEPAKGADQSIAEAFELWVDAQRFLAS